MSPGGHQICKSTQTQAQHATEVFAKLHNTIHLHMHIHRHTHIVTRTFEIPTFGRLEANSFGGLGGCAHSSWRGAYEPNPSRDETDM